MEKINEQMEVIILSLVFLKNCYTLIKLCGFVNVLHLQGSGCAVCRVEGVSKLFVRAQVKIGIFNVIILSLFFQ